MLPTLTADERAAIRLAAALTDQTPADFIRAAIARAVAEAMDAATDDAPLRISAAHNGLRLVIDNP